LQLAEYHGAPPDMRWLAKKTELNMEAICGPGARLMRTAVLTAMAFATPFVRGARAAPTVAPKGKMVLAWHTNIAARWLDPQQHDGTATPDNFLNALHDGLIKNFGQQKYDHLALAES
jgi:hypothetical protein